MAKTKATSKKKAAVGNTMTVAGRRYTKESCGHTKAGAKARAAQLRAKGNTARMKKTANGYCVFKGSKRKKAA